MLTNGATLAFKKKTGSAEYKILEGLQEIPEMGTEPEKVDITVLTDAVKKSENGIGEAPELAYKFLFKNDGADTSYRQMREAEESGEVYSFKETLSDGTVTQYDAQVSVKRGGGGVNTALDFTVTMALQSDFKYIDPV